MGKGHISHRFKIRWLPEPGSEPTSTLVLTSPSGWYIDIRLLLPRDTPPPSLEINEDELLQPAKATNPKTSFLPAEKIDWAFTGTSIATPATETTPAHSEWTHWVDSKTPFHDDPITDAGDMYPLTSSRVLEKGRMPNPATGMETAYEELWDDIAMTPLPSLSANGGAEKASCVILTTENVGREVRGCIMRLGGWCQGILRVGGEVRVERWRVSEGGSGEWEFIAGVGDEGVGCECVFGDDEGWEVGKVVVAKGREWKVRELDWSW